MKLIKKKTTRTSKLVEAVASVSGYSEREVLTSRKHNITPWAHLGIYIARKTGMTYEEAAWHFGRHFTSGWLSVKKVEDSLQDEGVQESIDEIINLTTKLNNNET